MFGVVTFVQMIGNIFYSYKEIEPNGELFIAWVELTSPIFELFGTEPTDIIAHKRWLAILGGGLLPIISLTSLHFFVKYEEPEKPIVENDRDTEINLLMDLENVNEEKPKSKRGRKKKVIDENQFDDEFGWFDEQISDEISQDNINTPQSTETTENEVFMEKEEEPIVEEKEKPPVTETSTQKPQINVEVISPNMMIPRNEQQSRGRKLTYTKIQ
jgi:hypothetical protein